MSLELCVLASGSAGNCTAVRSPAGVLLIDAGIGPRVLAKRACGSGMLLADVRAICLTHLDRDHFSASWLGTIISRKIKLFVHQSRRGELVEISARYADEETISALDEHVQTFGDADFEAIAGLTLRPIALAHDEAGSHGFVIDGFGCRVGYATDLGRVPDELIELFDDLDVLAIESNYDPRMQRESGRPWFLQKRITGGRGHLSNEQALAAVRGVFDRSQQLGRRHPSHVVLLHRSRECNCPKLLRSLFERDARLARRLTLAEQYARTEWIRPAQSRPLVGEQLSIAWG